jgi:NAD(P)-dependent dehydrogenase (short-subunit alcohol dehydrogenase family)
MRIDGSVALVTGAASGLGRAAATRLHAAGAKLVLVDTSRDGGKELADEGVGTFIPADVTSESDAREAVSQATALGPLRVLVNCAGVGWGARIVDRSGSPHDLALFRQILDINLVGTFNMMRLAAAAMPDNNPAVVEVLHAPAQRDRVPAVVADNALGLPGRAGGVQDVQRIRRGDRDAIRGLRRGHPLGPVQVPARGQRRPRLRPLQDHTPARLVL